MSAAARHLPARRSAKRAATAPRQGDPLERWNRYREQHNPLRGLTMSRAVSLVESYPRGEFADLMWTLGAPFVGIEAADADLCAIVGRRADALYEMDWNAKEMAGDRVDPSLAQEQAAFIDELAESVEGLEDVVEHLALAACRGFSLVEIVPKWTERGVELLTVDHWNIVRDGLRGDWFYNPSAMQVGAMALGEELRLDPLRFIIREVKRPFGRIAVAKFVRSNLAERDWSAFAEIFGLPSGVVTMPADVPENREAEYEAAARAIAEGGSGALPHGADYKPNPAVTGKSGAPFREFLDYLTEKLVLIGTGGKLTMLAESGSGTLAGGAHAEVWEQLARAEAVRISRVLQKDLFAPALRAAWPGRPVSAYWELAYREEVDASQVVDDAVKLKSAGYRIDAAELAEKTGYALEAEAAEPPSRDPERERLRNRAPGGRALGDAAAQGGIFGRLMEQWETVLAEAMAEAVADGERQEEEDGGIRNAGTSDGARKGWETRRRNGWTPKRYREATEKGDDLAEFYRASVAAPGGAPNARMPWATVDADEAAALEKHTGLSGLSGFRHELDAYAARHIHKAHGDPAKEEPRGQVAVTADDIRALPRHIALAQEVEFGGRTRQGRDTIRYYHQQRGTTVVVEEVRTGRRSLVPASIRKFKGKVGPGQLESGDEDMPSK